MVVLLTHMGSDHPGFSRLSLLIRRESFCFLKIDRSNRSNWLLMNRGTNKQRPKVALSSMLVATRKNWLIQWLAGSDGNSQTSPTVALRKGKRIRINTEEEEEALLQPPTHRSRKTMKRQKVMVAIKQLMPDLRPQVHASCCIQARSAIQMEKNQRQARQGESEAADLAGNRKLTPLLPWSLLKSSDLSEERSLKEWGELCQSPLQLASSYITTSLPAPAGPYTFKSPCTFADTDSIGTHKRSIYTLASFSQSH